MRGEFNGEQPEAEPHKQDARMATGTVPCKQLHDALAARGRWEKCCGSLQSANDSGEYGTISRPRDANAVVGTIRAQNGR